MKPDENKKCEINKKTALTKTPDDENEAKNTTLGIAGLFIGGLAGGLIGIYFFEYTESGGLAVLGGYIGYFIASGGDPGIIKYFFK